MFQGHRIGALLLMGGEGRRMGGEIPKQFCPLFGKRLYLHALKPFLHEDLFDEIVLACHPAWVSSVAEEVARFPRVQCVAGGATRQASSYAGLQALSTPPAIVSIHDAVRPFVSERLLEEGVRMALEQGAANTCIPSADTLVFAPRGKIASIPERKDYLRGQTPQTFRYEWIVKAHEQAIQEGVKDASDDCRLALNAGYEIAVVWGSEQNMKITTEFDLALAQVLFEQRTASRGAACR